jgi:hypothetical protein
MAENPGAGGANTVAAVAQVVRRVALGDLRNVVAGGRRLGGPRLGGPDAVLKVRLLHCGIYCGSMCKVYLFSEIYYRSRRVR